MRPLNFKKTLFLACCTMFLSVEAFAGDCDKIWYSAPASDWMEGVPVGNGRLGAIVYGGIALERIALNEITLWSGQPDTLQNTICGPEKLAEIRSFFFKENYKRANDLTIKYLSGTRSSFGTHLPLGDLVIKSEYPEGELKGFRRELDMAKGVSMTTFIKGGVKFTRELICDYPDDVMALMISADKKGCINTEFSFDLLRDAVITAERKGLSLEGKVCFPKQGRGGVEFAACLLIDAIGGEVFTDGNKIRVKNADSVTAYLDIRTDLFDKDYRHTVKNTVDHAQSLGYGTLRSNHVADHAALYDRMSISLGTPSEMANLPTDVRLHLIKNGALDSDFDALFFRYGRYMQIASSRPRSPLCSNLQGIWNDNRACHMGWTCDYHLDINIQQNYWSSNKVNLPECNEALFTFIKFLDKHGRETAKNIYGARGWVAHTVVNAWGYTAPDNAIYWGLNVTAGAWLATQLWSHYKYTLDRNYLADTAYPLLKGCAEFFMDYMVEDPNTGYLVTGPSISPEVGFLAPDGNGYSASMMPTLDRAVVAEIYSACIESSKLLGIDKKFRHELEQALEKFPPYMIDSQGEVQEWLHGFPRQDKAHRHTSHLIALYPLGQLSWTKTPELMEAAKRTITNQTQAHGWEDTEWSAANMLCFNSFLKEGDMAHEWLQDLFRKFTRENLMTVSPKGIAGADEDIFSFDATEASIAGMCDMLLQSYDGFVEFLPALPKAWPQGRVCGLGVEGGFIADLEWNDSAMRQAVFTATADAPLRLAIPMGTDPEFAVNNKKTTGKRDKDGFVNFKLHTSDKLTVNF